MLKSKKLSDLRADVKVNCEKFLMLCKEAGLNVLVTETLRDDEYQASLYAIGRRGIKGESTVTNSKVTTFHGAGLAFDICKNVKGKEYDDADFFAQCGQIGKQVGFSWGGDWKYTDKPHFQWDAGGKFNGTQVRGGKLPPEMEEYMTQAEFNKMADAWLASLRTKQVSSWAKESWEKAEQAGIMDGKGPKGLVTREELAKVIQSK